MPKKDGHVRVIEQHGSSYRCTIPKDLASEFDLSPGDDLWWEKHKDHLEVYPVEVRPKTNLKRFGGDE